MAVLLGNGICFAQDSVPNLLSDSNQVMKNDTIQKSSGIVNIPQAKEIPIQQTNETEQSGSGQTLFLIISVIVLAILVIGLFVFVFIDRRKRREMVIDTITNDNNYVEGHRLKQWLDSKIINSVKNKINMPTNQNIQLGIKDEIESLRDKIDDFEIRITEIEKKLKEKPAQPVSNIRSNISESMLRRESPASPVEQKKLYAMNIIDGIFNKVSEQISGTPIFELTLSSPNSATFTVYRGAYSTVLAAPEYLEGCDKQTLNSNPTNLRVVEGKASLQSDGKWKIDQKASVRLV